jgi:hypothetical protein
MSQLQYETFLVRREGLTRDLPAGHPRPRRSRLRHRAAAGGLPRAHAVATAGTIAEARVQASDEYRDGFWGRLFPARSPQPALPAELPGDTILLEGHDLRVIEAGHTDTTGTTALWSRACA